MRALLLISVAVLGFPSWLLAGPVYGSVLVDGAAAKGASITIACGNDTAMGATLDDGTYRIRVAPEGKCVFTVSGKPFGTASAEIVSASSAVRYVFNVVKGAGGYELRRQ